MARRNARGQFVKGGSGKRRSHKSHSHGGAVTKTRRSGGGTTNITVRAPSSRAPVKHHKRRSGHRRSGGMLGSVGNFLGGKGGHRTAVAMGALLLGYASKEGWLQKIPVVGKAGPITSFGLIGFAAEEWLGVRPPQIVSDAITASLALSAFNIGFSGGQTLVGDGGASMPGGAVFFD